MGTIEDAPVMGANVQVEKIEGFGTEAAAFGGGDRELIGRFEASKSPVAEGGVTTYFCEPDAAFDVRFLEHGYDDPGFVQGGVGDDVRVDGFVVAEDYGEVFLVGGGEGGNATVDVFDVVVFVVGRDDHDGAGCEGFQSLEDACAWLHGSRIIRIIWRLFNRCWRRFR